MTQHPLKCFIRIIVYIESMGSFRGGYNKSRGRFSTSTFFAVLIIFRFVVIDMDWGDFPFHFFQKHRRTKLIILFRGVDISTIDKDDNSPAVPFGNKNRFCDQLILSKTSENRKSLKFSMILWRRNWQNFHLSLSTVRIDIRPTLRRIRIKFDRRIRGSSLLTHIMMFLNSKLNEQQSHLLLF